MHLPSQNVSTQIVLILSILDQRRRDRLVRPSHRAPFLVFFRILYHLSVMLYEDLLRNYVAEFKPHEYFATCFDNSILTLIFNAVLAACGSANAYYIKNVTLQAVITRDHSMPIHQPPEPSAECDALRGRHYT